MPSNVLLFESPQPARLPAPAERCDGTGQAAPDARHQEGALGRRPRHLHSLDTPGLKGSVQTNSSPQRVDAPVR